MIRIQIGNKETTVDDRRELISWLMNDQYLKSILDSGDNLLIEISLDVPNAFDPADQDPDS